MGQEIATATGLSSSVKGWLARIEREPPGTPLSICSRTKTEATAALAAIDEALKPAAEGVALRWITALGTLTATRPEEADALGKARAYAAMLEFPANAFNRASLDAAARKFRWFPSYAEVCEHLEAETAEAKRLRHQLRRLVALPVKDDRPPPRYRDLAPEQRAQFDEIMAPLRRGRKEADEAPQAEGRADPDSERAADA